MTNALSNWQDAIDNRLLNRLTRPLRQPGIMNMRMGQRIINRCDLFLNRLPLLNQQMQRWGNINTLSSESIPIVYAQPVKLAKEQQTENRLNNSQATLSHANPANTVIQRKLDTSQSLPTITELPSSNFADESTIFFDLKSQINSTAISSPKMPVVAPQATFTTYPQSDIVDSTENPTSAAVRISTPLGDRTAISSPEMPIVPPQATFTTNSQSDIVDSTENPASAAVRISTPLSDRTAISSPEMPIVSPKAKFTTYPQSDIVDSTENQTLPTLRATDNLLKSGYPPTQVSSSAPLREPKHINISTAKNNQQNISPLPLVSVISPTNPPLKHQSSPLPLAKTTASSKSNSQQLNNSSTTNKDYSPPPRNLAISPTETSLSSLAKRNTDIDVDTIASQVERKLMRRLVIESERRGKNR